MASLHATLVCVSETEPEVASCMGRINKLMSESTTAGRFATMFYGTLELETRRLTYCNAGHNPPILLRAGGVVERLEVGGVPVGFMPDWKYEMATVELASGDLLLLYSDGLSEAENPRGAQFGDDGVEVLVKSLAKLTPEQIVDQMLLMIKRFAAGAPQMDDQTLVALRVL
jgi:sigma-B regulation protein RsbU (phosphoserine phosphatase)